MWHKAIFFPSTHPFFCFIYALHLVTHLDSQLSGAVSVFAALILDWAPSPTAKPTITLSFPYLPPGAIIDWCISSGHHCRGGFSGDISSRGPDGSPVFGDGIAVAVFMGHTQPWNFINRFGLAFSCLQNLNFWCFRVTTFI